LPAADIPRVLGGKACKNPLFDTFRRAVQNVTHGSQGLRMEANLQSHGETHNIIGILRENNRKEFLLDGAPYTISRLLTNYVPKLTVRFARSLSYGRVIFNSLRGRGAMLPYLRISIYWLGKL